MPYNHGVYGSQAPTTDTLPPSGVATLPVYIGTAPVQQLASVVGAINMPILVNTFDEAKAALGYSDDWDTFTLCEAMYAHFRNKIQPIGPIVLINVMDTAKHTSESNANVAITDGVGYIDEPAVLSSIVIADKVLNTDFKVEYTSDGRVKIAALEGKTLVNPSVATFDIMDVTSVLDADIIGSLTEAGARTGMYCIDLVYRMFNMIPTLFAAPGWSQIKAIKEAMILRAAKINGHWDALALADIDSSDATADTLAEAITWKETNGYTDVNLKVGWPKISSGGKIYWLSTVMGVRMQQTDYANGNVPFESPSNKQIDCTAAVLPAGTVMIYDEIQSNQLNQNGITTVNFRGGIWVLWGPHNANYKFGAEIDPKNVFDAGIRMMMYLTNSFQENYMSDVDGPLNRSKVGTIINDAQTWLNGLIADGKLLYGTIAFNETSNPTSSIVEGDFTFDIATTTTPVGKSLSFVVQYTTKGIDTLFGGEA